MKYIYKLTISFLVYTLLTIGCRPKDSLGPGPENLSKFETSQDSLSKIFHIAYQNIIKNENYQYADSVINEGIKRSINTLNVKWQFRLYKEYFDLPELSEINVAQSKSFAQNAELLALNSGSQIEKWNLTRSLVNYYIDQKDTANSIKNTHRLFDYSSSIDNPEFTSSYNLALAKVQNLNGDAKGALKSFMNASYLAIKINNHEIVNEINQELSKFYDQYRMYKKALEYKLKEIEYLRKYHPEDTVNTYHAELTLLDYKGKTNPEKFYDENKLFEILDFSRNNGYKRLNNFAHSFLRSSFLDSHKFIELYKLYQTKYHSDFESMKLNDSITYFRINAYNHFAAKSYDSAKYYFNLIENTIKSQLLSPGQLARYKMRYGDFLMATGNLLEAKKAYTVALASSEHSGKLTFIIEPLEKLISLSEKNNDFKEAFHFQNKYIEINKRFDFTQSEDIFKMEIEHEERILQEEKKQEDARIQREHNIQYYLFIVALSILFILLLIMVSYRVPIWVIKTMGFFGFIFLFEFIILIADNFIHHATHGTPWKILGIKVLLIGMLFPLHHWVEKKVIHFLLHKRSEGAPIININFQSLRTWFTKFNEEG